MADKLQVAICSHRLGGTDGVAIEAAKWESALRALGHETFRVAGSGTADVVVPALRIDATAVQAAQAAADGELVAAFSGADLVVVENICSLKMNPSAANLVNVTLKGRRALFHHHDLAIERRGREHLGPPLDDAKWTHACISDRARRDLAQFAISATTIYNHFDPDPPSGDRAPTRARLGIDDATTLVLQPTRAIARKAISIATHLCEAIGATFWLLGGPEDGYDDELAQILTTTTAPVIRPTTASFDIHDAYAACDLVSLPSTWEGFGNPTIESATHRRPLAIGEYPVAKELARYGFRWFPASDPNAVARYLAAPDIALIDRNAEIARKFFALADLPERLAPIINAAMNR